MDRYALADVRRALRIGPSEAYVLEQLTKLAEHEAHCWSGTLTELAEFVGYGRNRIDAVVRRLVEVGAVVVHLPFAQRSEGLIEVLLWDELAVSDRSRNASLSRRKAIHDALRAASDQPIAERLGDAGKANGVLAADKSRDRVSLSPFDALRNALPDAEEIG